MLSEDITSGMKRLTNTLKALLMIFFWILVCVIMKIF